MKGLGLIVRSDVTGLGLQTRRLARLLKPEKLLLINSVSFNGNEQHPDWYKDYKVQEIRGFPSDLDVEVFLDGLDTVLSAETFYNNRFTQIAYKKGVRTALHTNPEFFDWYNPSFAFIKEPDVVIVPSKWRLKDLKDRFAAVYIPSPLFADEFGNTHTHNLEHIGKNYLFMNGKTAAMDRNGLDTLYKALRRSTGDFTVTIKAQHDITRIDDPRVRYDFSNPIDQKNMYRGYDLLIQPRRYGGQSLSMTEALYCAVPVVMTDIDPNDKVLPSKWLVPSRKIDVLQTRFETDVYTAKATYLAEFLDNYIPSYEDKQQAYKLGQKYKASKVRQQFLKVLT